MAILDENEFTEVDGRSYLNPQVALDESNAFIDNLRSTQQADNQKIQMDTYNLGTDISSNLGGLTSPVGNGTGGAGLSYFTSRYQVPQTAAAVANLRSVAQAQALNQALQNEQEIWKKKYNDAYRKYQKSAYDKSNTPSSTNPNANPTQEGEVDENIVSSSQFYGVPDSNITETDTHYIYTDPETGEEVKVSKDYLNQIYDENGNITDDGLVILDTRRLLGL